MAPGALTLKLAATHMFTREQCEALAYHVASLNSIRVEVDFHGIETIVVLPPGAPR